MTTVRCACGKPLHYGNPASKAAVQRLVDDLGPEIAVTVGDRTWMVQRHYIALHGLKAEELPTLGFPEVTGAKQ